MRKPIAQVSAVGSTILRNMPPGMTPPNVIQFNASNVPVVQLTARSDTLSEQEIADYIATGEPNDKAGAYAIQGRAARWIPRIEGCYFNVVGLPIALVSTLLDSITQTEP